MGAADCACSTSDDATTSGGSVDVQPPTNKGSPTTNMEGLIFENPNRRLPMAFAEKISTNAKRTRQMRANPIQIFGGRSRLGSSPSACWSSMNWRTEDTTIPPTS